MGFPFIFGWLLIFSGWEHRDNACPRNLVRCPGGVDSEGRLRMASSCGSAFWCSSSADLLMSAIRTRGSEG